MRTILTVVVLVLAVGVGRGDPPPAPATLSRSAPLPAIPPLAPDGLSWKRTERIDTPVPHPTAEKPDPKKLKEEMDKLLVEQTGAAKDKEKDKAEPADERTRMRNKLDELIEKLDQKKTTKPPPPTTPPKQPHDPPEASKPLLPEGGKGIDLVRAAGNLFRSGDAAAADELLKLVDNAQLAKEDRAFADYLRAACLRKAGKSDQALKLYRAIAEAKDDPFLAENALLQITAIKSAQELEAQLEQLKSRKKPK
jgi:hypothetical protein